MPKIVLNKCYGGFSISPEACLWLFEHGFYSKPENKEYITPVEKYFGGDEKTELTRWRKYLKDRTEQFCLFVFTPDEKYVLDSHFSTYDTPKVRADELLVQCVETLGDKANGQCAKLRIVEIPDDVDWEIDEYDGMESVEEKHRSWG